MSNVDAARTAFEAFSQGDLATVKDSFAQNIVWSSPDSVRPGGERRGLDAMMGLFAEIPDSWTEFGLDASDFIDAGDRVIVVGAQRAGSAKGSVSVRFACVLTYDQDGKVSNGEFFSDTAKIAELQT
jgi:uncharacterized protein